jgi:hypothetical protein
LMAADLGWADLATVRLAGAGLVATGWEEGVAVLRFMNISSAERGTGGSNALCAKSINCHGQ